MWPSSHSRLLQSGGSGVICRPALGQLHSPLPKIAYISSEMLRNRTSDLRRCERHTTACTSGRGSMGLEQSAYREETGSTTYRPWQFDLPTLEEMRHEDWPEKVRDWEMFWTRHAIWQNYIQYSSRKNARPRPGHEEWWGLHDVESVTMALSAVAERVPEILAMGVPIPEMISFDKFNVFSDRRELDMYGKKKINHFGLDMELRKELNPLPLEEDDQDAPAPWAEWTAWDFRAYMEKRRQHERQYADFVRRQNAVGQNDYLNVSPFTDHRILTNYIDQTGELPSRSTHEEFMNLITNNGRSVHPNAVSIREQDPLERADWFQEGVHHVPETEDFLHALGHWKSSDHDLIWRSCMEEALKRLTAVQLRVVSLRHREEAASPTLNEAFADFEDALPTDRESVAYEGAEPIMSSSSASFEGKDSEDSSEPEAGDDAFEQGN